jgi:hypothetical protein
LSFLKRQHKRRKKKFKSYDLNRYILPKYYNPFKKRHKNVLLNKKRVSLFYGGIKDKKFKLYKNLVKKERKNLRKNKVIFKKVDKMKLKNLNEGLKNMNINLEKQKTSVFVEKFEMNKRDYLLNIKKSIGIAGKLATKTKAFILGEKKRIKKKRNQRKR